MIQRIQTIYLFLAALACVAFIFIPFGQIKDTNGSAATWHIYQVTPIMVSAIITGIASLLSIFLFNNRKTQMKAVIASVVLTIITIGLFIFGITQHIGLEKYIFGIGAIAPVFALIFNILAYSAIKSDEHLVRSMDRLR